MRIETLRNLVTLPFGLLFFMNIPSYLYIMERLPVPPLSYIKLMIACILFTWLMMMLCKRKLLDISQLTPIMCWVVFFLLISIIGFIFSDHSEVVSKVLRLRILSVIVLCLFLFMLHNDPVLLTRFRKVILVAVLLGVVINIYDFFFPFSLVPAGHLLSNPGRAGGLYINANGAGGALMLGMILTVGLLPPRWRTLFVLVVLSGIAMTISRSAILGFMLVAFIMIVQKSLSIRQSLVGFALAALLVSRFIVAVPEFFQQSSGINVANVQGRIDWFADPASTRDHSAEERKNVAALAWEMFKDHPLLGNGLASTVEWDEQASTHNLHLTFLAEHGCIGALILPLLVLAATWRAQGEALRAAVPFAVFILFMAGFSHNIIDDYGVMVSVAVMTSMSIQNRFTGRTTG